MRYHYEDGLKRKKEYLSIGLDDVEGNSDEVAHSPAHAHELNALAASDDFECSDGDDDREPENLTASTLHY